MFKLFSTKSSQCIFKKCFNNLQIKRAYCQPLYIQGQRSDPKIREYFYYIDHEGMLFLDDARIKNFTSCFKDKKFIQFFFKRLKFNTTNRYRNEFPYLSLCGNERNYVRCDDLPIVFTDVITSNDEYTLSFAHAGTELQMKFEPQKVFMSPETGRVYHPANVQYGSIGLVRSKLAIQFSKYFKFENGESASPTHFTWNNKCYTLEDDWLAKMQLPENRKML